MSDRSQNQGSDVHSLESQQDSTASDLLLEELEENLRLLEKRITKLEEKLEDYRREMDEIDNNIENLSSEEDDDDEVSRNNEEDGNCNYCQNDDDDDDDDGGGWYPHYDEDDEHNNAFDQQYAPVQNLYLADNPDHADVEVAADNNPIEDLIADNPDHADVEVAADNDPVEDLIADNPDHADVEVAADNDPVEDIIAQDDAQNLVAAHGEERESPYQMIYSEMDKYSEISLSSYIDDDSVSDCSKTEHYGKFCKACASKKFQSDRDKVEKKMDLANEVLDDLHHQERLIQNKIKDIIGN